MHQAHFISPAVKAADCASLLAMEATKDIFDEISDCLFSTALLTRALNRLIESGQVARIDTRVLFAREAAVVTRATIRGSVLSTFDTDTVLAIETLLDTIDEGKARLERFRIGKGRGADIDQQELREIAAHWRRICALGVFVHLCLKQAQDGDVLPARSNRLISLLTDAGHGRASPMH